MHTYISTYKIESCPTAVPYKSSLEGRAYTVIPDEYRRIWSLSHRGNLARWVSFPTTIRQTHAGYTGPVNCRWPNVTSDTPIERAAYLPNYARSSHGLWARMQITRTSSCQHELSTIYRVLNCWCCRRYYCCGCWCCCWCRSVQEEAVNQVQATSKTSRSRETRLSYRSPNELNDSFYTHVRIIKRTDTAIVRGCDKKYGNISCFVIAKLSQNRVLDFHRYSHVIRERLLYI